MCYFHAAKPANMRVLFHAAKNAKMRVIFHAAINTKMRVILHTAKKSTMRVRFHSTRNAKMCVTYHASRHSASPDVFASLLLCSGLMPHGLMAIWPRSWAHGLIASWPHGLFARPSSSLADLLGLKNLKICEYVSKSK